MIFTIRAKFKNIKTFVHAFMPNKAIMPNKL